MRTDIYFVVNDLLRSRSLYEDSLAFIRFQAQRHWRRISHLVERKPLVDPTGQLSGGERVKVIVFAWVLLAGSTIALAIFAFYGLPVLVELLVQATRSILNGIQSSQFWRVLDGAITLVIVGGSQVVFVLVFLKNRRH